MKKKEFFILSVTIFLTVIAWLIADVIHAGAEEKLKDKIIIPVTKTYVIDEKLLEILELKNPG